MTGFEKIQTVIIICFVIASLLGGCVQVSSDKHGAVYGSVSLVGQSDHRGVVISAKSNTLTTQGITDSTGTYVISGLSTGVYEVTVSKNGWYVTDNAQATKSVVITDGESIMNVNFILDSDLTPPSIN